MSPLDRKPEPGDRYIVVRVTEADIRTLMYAPEGERRITVDHEQEELILSPDSLRDLGMWDECKALAVDLHKDPVPYCEAWFGDRPAGGAKCLRAVGHPPLSEDGIGHSASARYQRL